MGLFDWFNKRHKNNKPIGVSGTPTYGGYIQEQEKNTKIAGRTKYDTYSDMTANVSIIAAGTRYFLNMCAKPNWYVEPADESTEAKEIAEKVEAIINDADTPWRRIVRRAAMYRFYGFSTQEWTAKRRSDGTIGFKDISPRPQATIERWDISHSGEVYGCWQLSPWDSKEIYLPRRKLVYIVDDSLNDSPEGLGLLRHVVELSESLQRFEELEAIGFETDMRGVVHARAPFSDLAEKVASGEITEANMNSILNPLKDFIQNHIRGKKTGIILDSSVYNSSDESNRPSTAAKWEVGLMSSGITSQDAIYTAIQRKTAEIARVLGVEGLLLGGGGGSLALSRDKSHNFHLIIDSTIKEIIDTFNKDILTPLMDLNGWDKELTPKFKTEAIQFRGIDEIARALKDIEATSLDPDDEAHGVMFDQLGLPRLDPNKKREPKAVQEVPRSSPLQEREY
jgi:hypothetical protein